MHDIGYTLFSHTRPRYDIADFSFGIMQYQIELYYVKHSKDLKVDAFIKSFRKDVWYLLATYAIILITGFVILALMIKSNTEQSTSNEVISALKSATNVVLRAVIGKRMTTEPNWFSTRIAFLSLVLSGFVIITVYRAILVAFVAIEIESPPVQSLPEIEKAISNTNLGLNPSTSSDLIRITMPALTEETRQDYIKQARAEAENSRVSIRNIRRDANQASKELQSSGEISEDNLRRIEDLIQKETDKYIGLVDSELKAKESDLLEI